MGGNYLQVRRAILLIFLVCGLALSSWAPMVPFTKERLGLNEAGLGTLLLFLGAGAIVMMPVTGFLIKKYGSRKVILFAGVALAFFLPLLLTLSHPVSMGMALFFFGAALGAVDVAMNDQAIRVQHLYDRHIMSSFHGFFSIGGLFGALGLGALIKTGLSPMTAAIIIAGLLLIIILSQHKYLLPYVSATTKREKVAFSWPKSPVIYLGLMCFIAFLAEGAVLDWSAVFLQFNRGFAIEWSGMGYAVFSVAMAVMRLSGDKLVNRMKPGNVVVYGSLVAAAGFFIAVFIPSSGGALIGFVLVGLGAANIVPIFFSAAGNMPHTPVHVALPAITTIGYAGQLAGPALLGYVAYLSSLPIAIGLIGVLLLIISITYRHRG